MGKNGTDAVWQEGGDQGIYVTAENAGGSSATQRASADC